MHGNSKTRWNYAKLVRHRNKADQIQLDVRYLGDRHAEKI